VELVTVMIVVGIVATMAATMFGKTLQSYLIGSEGADNAMQAQLALERMVRELRRIRSASSSDLTPSAGQISFVEQSSGSIIGFNLLGTTLYRTVTPSGTPVVLANNISALSFGYLTADGRAELTSPSAAVALIYYINARLTVTSQNMSLGYGTTVKPRSF
jgi:hypothetical protein